MMHKIRKFSKLTFREQLCFSEALFLQLAVGLLLKIVPFRKIPGLFAGHSGTTDVAGPVSEVNALILEQVRQASRRAGMVSPWKNRCLVQSLAARRMLNTRRIASQLSLGLAKNENNKVVAHAWLKSGDYEIVARAGDFQELFAF